jgi:hypothetical protein
MAIVGLFYVGVVLFVNGLMLLGLVDAKAAAPLNLFVGALQVLTPTYLIFTASGPGAASQILNASGLYLFGFTYLYVGIGLLAGLDGTGVGYYSLFVAIVAIGYSWANFVLLGNSVFGVIWLYWSFLWALFFVLLGLKREELQRYTGWVTAIEGWVTAAIPAFLLLTGFIALETGDIRGTRPGTFAVALAIFGVVVFGALVPLTRRRAPGAPARTPREAHPAAPAR